MLVESHIIDMALAEMLKGAGCPEDGIANVLAQPLWQFFLRDALNRDPSNKWAPTLAGLAQMCEQAQLQPIAQRAFGSRGAVLCRAVSERSLEDQLALDTLVGLNVS